MMTEQASGGGFGFELARHGQTIEFRHGGSGDGFKALIMGFLGQDVELAVLTDKDGGGAIRGEIARAVAAEYAWPAYRDTTAYTLDTCTPEDACDELQGTYRRASGLTNDDVSRTGALYTRFNRGQCDRLFPLPPTHSISVDEVTCRFTRNDDGAMALRYIDRAGTYQAVHQDP